MGRIERARCIAAPGRARGRLVCGAAAGIQGKILLAFAAARGVVNRGLQTTRNLSASCLASHEAQVFCVHLLAWLELTTGPPARGWTPTRQI